MFVQRRRVPQVTPRLNPCPQPWTAVSPEPVKSQRVWLLGRSNGTSAKYQANAFPFPAAFQTDDDGPLLGRPEAAGEPNFPLVPAEQGNLSISRQTEFWI